MRPSHWKRLINRSTLVLLAAGVAGVLAAWSAQRHIQNKVTQLEARARVPEVERVVVARDVAAGTRIQPSDLALRRFPAALVSSDSLSDQDYGVLEGGILQTSLRAGDLLLPVHITKPSAGAFSSTLREGRRAITMPVDAINAVSGLLQPGDLIDLYVSFEYQRRRITAPLLQGVLVLATGAITDNTELDGLGEPVDSRTGTAFNTVTLDAAPEDAVKLVAARHSGTLTAVLRHPADTQASTKASRGDLATLLGVNRQTAPPQRRASVLYGNQTNRSVPRLRSVPVGPPQRSGVFDLPYQPELTSAWHYHQDPGLQLESEGATLLEVQP